MAEARYFVDSKEWLNYYRVRGNNNPTVSAVFDQFEAEISQTTAGLRNGGSERGDIVTYFKFVLQLIETYRINHEFFWCDKTISPLENNLIVREIYNVVAVELESVVIEGELTQKTLVEICTKKPVKTLPNIFFVFVVPRLLLQIGSNGQKQIAVLTRQVIGGRVFVEQGADAYLNAVVTRCPTMVEAMYEVGATPLLWKQALNNQVWTPFLAVQMPIVEQSVAKSQVYLYTTVVNEFAKMYGEEGIARFLKDLAESLLGALFIGKMLVTIRRMQFATSKQKSNDVGKALTAIMQIVQNVTFAKEKIDTALSVPQDGSGVADYYVHAFLRFHQIKDRAWLKETFPYLSWYNPALMEKSNEVVQFASTPLSNKAAMVKASQLAYVIGQCCLGLNVVPGTFAYTQKWSKYFFEYCPIQMERFGDTRPLSVPAKEKRRTGVWHKIETVNPRPRQQTRKRTGNGDYNSRYGDDDDVAPFIKVTAKLVTFKAPAEYNREHAKKAETSEKIDMRHGIAGARTEQGLIIHTRERLYTKEIMAAKSFLSLPEFIMHLSHFADQIIFQTKTFKNRTLTETLCASIVKQFYADWIVFAEKDRATHVDERTLVIRYKENVKPVKDLDNFIRRLAPDVGSEICLRYDATISDEGDREILDQLYNSDDDYYRNSYRRSLQDLRTVGKMRTYRKYKVPQCAASLQTEDWNEVELREDDGNRKLEPNLYRPTEKDFRKPPEQPAPTPPSSNDDDEVKVDYDMPPEEEEPEDEERQKEMEYFENMMREQRRQERQEKEERDRMLHEQQEEKYRRMWELTDEDFVDMNSPKH